MPMTRPELPAFDNPPAVETLMGYHFAPLDKWGLLRLGQVWGIFQDVYPTGNVVEPLGNQFVLQTEQMDLNRLPLRAMFTNGDKSEVIQVQNSAFLRNWRKTAQNQDYTHYSHLKPRFQNDWETFTAFLAARKISHPQVFTCEVTYVNHLIRGKDWDSYGDLAKWLKFLAPRREIATNGRIYSYLPDAASVGLSVGYTLPESGLTLQYLAQSAVTMPEGAEVLQLSITAKCAPKGTSPESLSEMLDVCHDAVILGFDDATTEFAHQHWGKR
jgi:uncharacterized protein (TIGR04255 family)